jgi:hypothetical protein
MQPLTYYTTEESISNILNKEIQKLKEDLPRLVEKFLEEKEHKTKHTSSSRIETKDENKLHHSLKETFISWSTRADINCYTKIFEYENVFVRLTWLFILFGSLGVTGWIMSWSISSYLEYGVVSQIGVVYEQTAEFPAVTICDNYPFTTQQGLNYVKSFVGKSCKNLDDCKSATLAASDPSFNDSNRKLLGLNLNQISCFSGGDCKNDLHWVWHFDYGNCFQFNVGKNLTNDKIDKKISILEGVLTGFKMSIGSFTNSNITKVGTIGNSGAGGLGMKVFVHNSSVQPRWYSEGVYVKPGEISMIGIKRTFINNYPSPYTECTDTSSFSSVLYDFIINSNRTYRQKDCFDLCIQQSTISTCGCYSTKYDKLSSSQIRPCLNDTDWDCYNSVSHKIDLVECASQYCPLECNSIEYDLTVSSTISPTLNDYNSLNISSTISYEEYRTQFVNIVVYYSQLEYTLIEETPATTLASLIANLGGTMSLIVSVSFFTLIEICELFALLLHVIITKRLQKISF